MAGPPAAWAQPSSTQSALHSDVRVEYFGAERGYLVGQDNLTLLCVVRNFGPTPLGDSALRLRCTPISGLDYTSGNLTPTLPALATNQAVAYRWRFAPTDALAPLIASVILESISPEASSGSTASGPHLSDIHPADSHPVEPPQVTLTTVLRYTHPPRFGDQPAEKDGTPRAFFGADEAFVGNDRVGLHVVANDKSQPILLLAGRLANAWVPVASFLPVLALKSGEEGQLPWWESFRWRDTRCGGTKQAASITLVGTLGNHWRAELTLEARRDTAVLSARLHLVALRPMRCLSLQLPRLLTIAEDRPRTASRADGTAIVVPDSPSLLPDDTRGLSGRANSVTFGLAWPATTPLADGRWTPLRTGDGSSIIDAVQCDAGGAGVPIPKGGSLDTTFRLFAHAPSDTIRDALRFQIP